MLNGLRALDHRWRRNLSILAGSYVGLAILHLAIEALIMRPGRPFDDQIILGITRQIVLPLLRFTGTLLAPMVLLPFGVMRLIYPPSSGRAPAILLLAIVVGGMWILPLSYDVGREVRRAGLRSFATRAEPIVQAIHRFEREQGAPPASLAALVPNYVSVDSLQRLRLRACRTPEYRVLPRSDYPHSATWAIEFACPNLEFMALDRLYYASNAVFPLQPPRPGIEYFQRWEYFWD